MEIKQITLTRVLPSPLNPRKTFDEGAIKELADNIRAQGLLQPITVRPIKNNSGEETDLYEIVCGERRYRAFRQLSQEDNGSRSWSSFETIPAIVREMTDTQALEAMITENLQRKDVDPIEEAHSFCDLVAIGITPEEISARIGKSVRFVQDRMKLKNLIPELTEKVREGKMPINAALLISKLSENSQKDFLKNHFIRETVTFQEVKLFVIRLFLDLSNSSWYKEEPDFDGGCGRSCAVCSKNTANHGCLFYEMNSSDKGKCTDREMFDKKNYAYLLHQIQNEIPNLLKIGEELTKGKTIIGCSGWLSPDMKKVKEVLEKELETMQIPLVNVDKVLRSRCWYDADDERTKEMLENGKVFRVLNPFRYDTSVAMREEFWYVDEGNEMPVSGPAKKAKDLVLKLNEEERKFKYELTTATPVRAIAEKTELKSGPLAEIEKHLFLALILKDNRWLRVFAGLSDANLGKREEDIEKIRNSPDLLNAAIRAFIIKELATGTTPTLHQAAPFIEDIARMWCNEDLVKEQKKVQKKRDKTVAKITKELEELGYDTEGNKIRWEAEDVKDIPLPATSLLFEEYAEMRHRHPDAVLLFRLGGFYQTFGDDAQFTADTLGIDKSTHIVDGKSYYIASFEHQFLDEYLPKLTKTGRRIVICED